MNLKFPISKREKKDFNNLKKEVNFTDKYICIHLTVRDNKKRWSTYNFAKTGDSLYEMGYKIVITANIEEKEIVKEIQDLMKYKLIDLSGKTSLGVLAKVIDDSSLLITNNTTTSNIATTFNTPSIIIFQNSEIKKYAPINPTLHKIIDPVSDPQNVINVAKKLLFLETPKLFVNLDRNIYELSYRSLSFFKMLKN